ncbi:hypothetical protein DPSP01_003790 [Paraphaeosphaeria sporulosa]|uniref:Membrane-associated proteins in eicosanoid and glutathione metabolism n=1 Tax=Paraphaeosphaeria sporulosa TaxID=1460663 RepID=A0A177CT92_9PLEO|nr:uncharacterized protein CC84DRAFT_458574 [Paraphaeosphaeria sporulosa]OAG09969.1 hypothetical protein CC84DRAFT_458574 [Paraphaeosphaeria sporulosa]
MSSGFTATGLNYPLLAIPAYYVFSVVPHAYAMSILKSAGYKVNNSNPKASLSPANVQGKVPDAVFSAYQRAENAQNNNLEQLPLFAAAVLASILAERLSPSIKIGGTGSLDPTGLATFIGAWFAVRAAYNVAYIQIADHSKSFIRSVLWMTGSGLAIYQFYKAAQVLG